MKFSLPRRFLTTIFEWCSVAVFLIDDCCFGQDQTIEMGSRNVCRVICTAPDRSLHIGSGTYLRDEITGDWVLTAGHVIESQAASRGRVTCEFRNGETIGGVIDGYDPVYDQAAIKLDRKPNLPGCPIRSTPLQSGEKVWFVGYAHGREFLIRSGIFQNRGQPVKQGAKPDWCNASAGVISGMSGGPTFDANGQIVGNLWGSNGSETTFCCVNRNKLFLRKLFPNLIANSNNGYANNTDNSNSCNNGQSNNGQCNNGRCPLPCRPAIPTEPTKPVPNQTPCPACNCDLDPIIARLDKLESNVNRLTQQQVELAQTTANLIDASNRLIAELDRRTDPDVLAKKLPGIAVYHNGNNKGTVKLGESLRLNFVPKH